MAALAGGTVTQIARISQIFLRCYACRGLTRGFILLLAVLAEAAEVEYRVKFIWTMSRWSSVDVVKSRKSCKFLFLWDFVRVRGLWNLINLYKVSLTACDGLYLCLIVWMCDCLSGLTRFFSPARGAREIYKSYKFLFLWDFVRVRGLWNLINLYKVSLTACDELFFCYARGGNVTQIARITQISLVLRSCGLTRSWSAWMYLRMKNK